MEKKVIARNGLPIYYYENNALHRFCMTLYIKAGILYEREDETGITHLLEHMVFRNINRVLDGKMKQCLDKMGVYFNGATFKEFVELKIIASNRYFKECADIMSKIFEDIDIPVKEYNAEIRRIKSEIREDDEKKSIDYIAGRTVWKDTCLEKSIAGKKSIVSNIDMDRVKEYAKEVFTKENMFLYITGAVDEEDIVYLRDKVGEYTLEEAKTIKKNIAPIPTEFMERQLKVKIKKGDYCSIRFSFDFDNKMCNKTEIDLLYDILFDGECSKVHEELSEKTGYIYSYSSSLEQYNNIGNIYFSYEIDRKNLIKSIKKVIKLLKCLKKGIGEELSYVLPNYVDNGDMDLDDPEKLNWIMAYEGHILNQNYKDIQERKQAYSNVTPEEITKLARKIFNTKNMVVTIKLDKEEDKNNKKENTKKNKITNKNIIKEKDITPILKTLD